MGIFGYVRLRPESMVVGTKAIIGAEVHSPFRWQPNDILVGRGKDKFSNNCGSLSIEWPKGCWVESETKKNRLIDVDLPVGFCQARRSVSEDGCMNML